MPSNPVLSKVSALDLIENSFRFCGVDLTTIDIETNFALYLLNEILISWSNLPTIQFNELMQVVPLENSVPTYELPNNIYNVLEANRVKLVRQTVGAPFSTQGVAANAFDGNLSTACTFTYGPLSELGIVLAEDAVINYVGISSAVAGSFIFKIEYSFDGISWETAATNTPREEDYKAFPSKKNIRWFSINAPQKAPRWKIVCYSETAPSIRELYFMTQENSIYLGAISHSTYMAIPAKDTKGTPTSYAINKNVENPYITVWPVPSDLDSPTTVNIYNYLVLRALKFPLDINFITRPLDINSKFLGCLRKTLTYYLSLRYAPQLSQNFREEMLLETKAVLGEDADQGSVYFNLPNASTSAYN
jgi:hypothetical protein